MELTFPARIVPSGIEVVDQVPCMRPSSFRAHTLVAYGPIHGIEVVYQVLVYEASRYWCMRPQGSSVCGLKLLVYEALSY